MASGASREALLKREQNYRRKQRQVFLVLLWILVLNWTVAGVKLVAGYISGSAGLIGAGFNALMDGSSNLVGMVGVTLASQPPDRDHPYGHHKFEALASLIVALLLFFALWQVGTRTIREILSPTPIEVSPLVVGLTAGSILISFAAAGLEYVLGRRLSSQMLISDARYSAADGMVTLTVLAALGGVYLGAEWLDWFVSVVVMVVIFRSAWSIILESLMALTDVQRIDPEEVRRIALSFAQVGGAHKIRSHGTRDRVVLDLHVQLPGSITNRQAHAIAHRIKDRLLREFPELTEVTIHTEPLAEEEEAKLLSERGEGEG